MGLSYEVGVVVVVQLEARKEITRKTRRLAGAGPMSSGATSFRECSDFYARHCNLNYDSPFTSLSLSPPPPFVPFHSPFRSSFSRRLWFRHTTMARGFFAGFKGFDAFGKVGLLLAHGRRRN